MVTPGSSSFLDGTSLSLPAATAAKALRDAGVRHGSATAEAELSFDDWTQNEIRKDPAFAREPRSEQALRYLHATQKDRLWISKLSDQILTNLESGFAGLGYQAAGLGAALTGNQTLQNLALHGQYSQLLTDLTDQGVPRAEAHERARQGTAFSPWRVTSVTSPCGAPAWCSASASG